MSLSSTPYTECMIKIERPFCSPLVSERMDLSDLSNDVDHFEVPSEERSLELMDRVTKAAATLKFTCNLAMMYPCDNRYNDNYPYDANMYSFIPGRYYNVSPIQLDETQYLAAQGPQEGKESSFWSLVVHARSSVIVMATDAVEKGVSKCAPYWEKLPKGITLVDEEKIGESGEEKIVRRRFFVEESKLNVTQLHYQGWRDMGVPDLQLFDALCEFATSEHKAGPILVHCSAGCGRTGVFIGCHTLKNRLFHGAEEVNIPALVFEMRRCRRNMVAKPAQLRLIYQYVAQKLSSKPPSEVEETFFDFETCGI